MTFTVKEVLELLGGRDDEWLFAEAARLKEDIYGREVFLRGIVENSSYCRNNCFYCGLRVDNGRGRYRLDVKATVAAALRIRDSGIGSIVLQAGEEPSQENIAFLDEVIPAVKTGTEADITLSHGDFPDEVYARWKELGADRYLIKMETMQPEYHSRIRPGATVEARLSRIESLIKLGYQVGSGLIAGMPGYTDAMLAEDLVNLSGLGLHMFSLSPFISAPGTPWEREPPCPSELVYRTNAVYRILDPKVNIPVTNALNVLDPDNARKKGLKRGCNVIMHSFTPAMVRKDYEIYAGKGIVRDEALDALDGIRESVREIGLFIREKEPGRSKKEMTHG